MWVIIAINFATVKGTVSFRFSGGGKKNMTKAKQRDEVFLVVKCVSTEKKYQKSIHKHTSHTN